jgi:hypothetical protein
MIHGTRVGLVGVKIEDRRSTCVLPDSKRLFTASYVGGAPCRHTVFFSPSPAR